MFSRIKSPAKPYRLQLKLKKIGQQLRQLIQLDDIDSELKALQLIDMHQQESDVINAQHFHQSPPLILACELGKTKIVERLLATKCIDVNLMGRSKNNALQVALQAMHYDIALLLAMDTRLHINTIGASSFHPVFLAINASSSYSFSIHKTLLSRPDIDLTITYRCKISTASNYHYYFRTMLHSFIRELYKLQSNEGMTQNYHDGLDLLTHMLATRSIDINAFEIDYDESMLISKKATALMLAVIFHLPDVVSLLLAYGANPYLDNEERLSAVNIARIHSFDTQHYCDDERRVADQIIEILKEHVSHQARLTASTAMFGTLNDIPDAKPSEQLQNKQCGQISRLLFNG